MSDKVIIHYYKENTYGKYSANARETTSTKIKNRSLKGLSGNNIPQVQTMHLSFSMQSYVSCETKTIITICISLIRLLNFCLLYFPVISMNK